MNLQYWRQPQKISRQVAREVLELVEYNLEIHHIKGKANGQADALSRQPDYDQGERDNEGITVLANELFVHATTEAIINATSHEGIINPEDVELQQPCYDQNEDVLRGWVDLHQLKNIHGTWY